MAGESQDDTNEETDDEEVIESNKTEGGDEKRVNDTVESPSVEDQSSNIRDQHEEKEEPRQRIERTHSQKGADEKFCSSCGEIIKQQAEICPHCGVRKLEPESTSSANEKNPGLAAIASFLFTGLGQIYNGEIGKGVLFIIVQIINIGLMLVVIGFLTFPLVWIYGIYDAYKTAEKINEGVK